jgi:hypothetical protein
VQIQDRQNPTQGALERLGLLGKQEVAGSMLLFFFFFVTPFHFN